MLVRTITNFIRKALPVAIHLFIKVPVGVVSVIFGLVICTSVIFIPVGYKMMKAGTRMIFGKSDDEKKKKKFIIF